MLSASLYSQTYIDDDIEIHAKINTTLILDSIKEAEYHRMTKSPGAIEFPDFEASYEGGVHAFQELIKDNLNYSIKKLRRELRQRSEIHISIKFKLKANGNIDDLELVSGAHPKLELELERIIHFGKWIRGEHHGARVDAFCFIDLEFRQKNYP